MGFSAGLRSTRADEIHLYSTLMAAFSMLDDDGDADHPDRASDARGRRPAGPATRPLRASLGGGRRAWHPPDLLPRIFDPFFTTKTSGKGLGLAICHSIVQRHEGHVEVQLPRSGGATFRVLLPAVDASAGSALPAAKVHASLPTTALRILVMDDEAAVRRLIARLLRPLGYEVVEAGDGKEAVARYAEALAAGRPFDALIIDLTIPGAMGGVETLGGCASSTRAWWQSSPAAIPTTPSWRTGPSTASVPFSPSRT